MKQRAVLVHAERVGGQRKKVKTSPKGRCCELCDVELSQYNHTNRCYPHRLRERVQVRGVA